VSIPADVVGQKAGPAKSELSRAGFSNVAERTQESTAFNPGDVITTDPPPGTSIKSDHRVVLVVSSGPPNIAVPDVTNDPAGRAESTLRRAGFKVTTIPQYSDTVATNDVITTNPSPGSKVPEGTAVQLVLSAGKQLVVLPSLIGEDPAVAGAKLSALNLLVTQATEASNGVPSGSVTRTSPPAGSSVPVGSTVTVYVSSGKVQVNVPSLVGDTQNAAAQALSAAGLVPSFIDVPVTDPAQNGKVQSTSPTGGTMVDSGSTVVVNVGVYTVATTSTTSTTAPSTTSTSSPPVS
jgi:serine/threonine-protein kinase